MESANLKKYKNRLLVSDLIFDVLTEKKTVAQALLLFPKDKNDINIKCAFDALVHREADEDLRKKIKDYATVQDDFLQDIALILKENHDLPKNVIGRYLKFHADDLISDYDGSLKKFLKQIKRMINF